MTSDGGSSTGSEIRNAAPKCPAPWFTVPEPVRCVFNRFPLRTYASNELPRRSPARRDVAILQVFNTQEAAAKGDPSFNPACLKWQAYLKFNGIKFRTASSNNHASPTGALPFLLPPSLSNREQIPPVPSNKLTKWTNTQTGRQDESVGMRYEAYSSLLDHRIRSAWLLNFYLDESNFTAVAKRLYINPTSSNTLVRATLVYQLQQAARDELLKYSAYIDEDDLYAEAANAFTALSTLLNQDENFFGQSQPGLFDASVFAYTHLLLEDNIAWRNTKLSVALKRNANLVRHRQRILEKYFSG